MTPRSESAADEHRGITNQNRGLPQHDQTIDPRQAAQLEAARLKALAPGTYRHPDGSPPTRQDFEAFSRQHGQMEKELHVWQFARPDGSPYTLDLKGIGTESQAQAWASAVGHGDRVIGEVISGPAVQGAEAPLTPPPLLQAEVEAPLTPPPLLQAPPPKRATSPALVAPTWHRLTAPPPSPEERSVPPSDEELLRESEKLRREHDERQRQIDEKLQRELIRGMLVEWPDLVSQWFGDLGLICKFVPPFEPYCKVFDKLGDGFELASIVTTALYEGIDAGGGRGARTVANKAFEKGVTRWLTKHVKEPHVVERVASFLVKEFDNIFGDMIEKMGRDVLRRVEPERLRKPLIKE